MHANLDEVLAPITELTGTGSVTTGDALRGPEGTTLEQSCHTGPLGIERLTVSLATAIGRVGTRAYGDGAALRFTTKFDAVDPLLALPHGGRTRVRFSVNATEVERFEGGIRPHARADRGPASRRGGLLRGRAHDRAGDAGDGWQESYGRLLDDVAAALAGVPQPDLTAEVITHRLSPSSKQVLEGWYPRTRLEMDESVRSVTRSKFGGVEHVCPKETMRALHGWFEREVPARLPGARLLCST